MVTSPLPSTQPGPLNRPWPDSYNVSRCPTGGYMAIDTDRYDGTATDGDHTVGYGKTEAEAVADLEEQYEGRGACA